MENLTNPLKIASLWSENQLVNHLLKENQDNKSKVAKILKIDRKTLYNKLIEFKKFKNAIDEYASFYGQTFEEVLIEATN